ncbi:MAG TPA: hypothetical protein DCP10_03405 [Bacteroidales bacterium]|nr:hypothetical protein [Bacteroidales bacterium]
MNKPKSEYSLLDFINDSGKSTSKNLFVQKTMPTIMKAFWADKKYFLSAQKFILVILASIKASHILEAHIPLSF